MKIGITGTKTYENRIKIKNFMFQLRNYDKDITVVGLGEKDGADRYIKKFALEFGYKYKEANTAHTPQNLFSMMSEMYYNKPYSPRNFFLRNKIYAEFIEAGVVFDDSNLKDTKVLSIVNALGKIKKQVVIVN